MDWFESLIKNLGTRADEKKKLAADCEEARKAIVRSLQPCPFCNSDKVDLQENTPTAMAGSIVTYAFVLCHGCTARGPKVSDWGNKNFYANAAMLWNNRRS